MHNFNYLYAEFISILFNLPGGQMFPHTHKPASVRKSREICGKRKVMIKKTSLPGEPSAATSARITWALSQRTMGNDIFLQRHQMGTWNDSAACCIRALSEIVAGETRPRVTGRWTQHQETQGETFFLWYRFMSAYRRRFLYLTCFCSPSHLPNKK